MVGGLVWCWQSLMACIASFLHPIWRGLIRRLLHVFPHVVSSYQSCIMRVATKGEMHPEQNSDVCNRKLAIYVLYIKQLGTVLMSNINKCLWVLQKMKKVPQIPLLKIYKLFCTWHGVCQSHLAAFGSALGNAGCLCNRTWPIHEAGSKSSY